MEDASVVLLNAVTRQDIDAALPKTESSQRVVLVGTSDFATGWPVLPRPLRLTALLTCLGALVAPVELVAQAVVPVVGASTVAVQSQPVGSAFVQIPLTARVPVSLPASIPAIAQVQTPIQAATAAIATPQAMPAGATALGDAAVKPVWQTQAIPASLADTSFRIGGSAIAPRPVIAPIAAAPGKLASFAHRTIDVTVPATPVAGAVVPSTRSVLIVDDSDVALKFMQSRLRHFGYEGLLARSGEEALAMTENQDFQFVFLDVMMAGMDGYQTCRAIKANKGRRAMVPVVVMLTSRGGTIDKIRGSMSGCDAYLTKPLNEQQLGMVLTQHSASKTAARTVAKAPVAAGMRPVASTFSALVAAPGSQKHQG